jgi:hypothetical protein
MNDGPEACSPFENSVFWRRSLQCCALGSPCWGLVGSPCWGSLTFREQPRTTTCIDFSLLASRYSVAGGGRARVARGEPATAHLKRVVDEPLRQRPFLVRQVTRIAQLAPDRGSCPSGILVLISESWYKCQGRLALNSRFTTLCASLFWTAVDGIP